MTKVYFVRHAQPEHDWEEDRTRPLTEEGKKDSEIVLEFLKDKKIDAFYCSPYKRSMDTIAEAAAFFTKEIITDERLREREKGSDGNNHGMFQKRWADHDYHEDGGESIVMVQNRNIEALNEILSDNTDKEIVIGTHGTALSTILNFYDNSFGCEEFLRIIDWMPYIIELDFEGDKLVGKQEHCHVQKEFKGKQWMVLWQECQLISEEKTAIGFWFKIKALLKYGVTDWGIYKQDISKIITTFQAMYYRAKQAELSAEIADIEKYLNGVNKNLLEDLCNQSMVVLKDKLARKYEGNSSRKTFSEDNLWKEPYDVLAEYPVILSTTFSSRNSLNSDVMYDYLIMDEASQVDIATGALALSCARNVVIVGDTKQLPNVVTDDIKAKAKAIFDSFNVSEGFQYTNSFLQSILDVMPNVTQALLREHYRCHPKIINFCNQKFYRGELIIMTTDKGEEDVLSVVKTVAGNHERNHYSQRQIDVIKNEIIPKYVSNSEETGIITPYKNQVEALSKEITDIDAATVHKFQGKEKENIIISTVDDEISDFADDPYLINVAVSRAKKKLMLVVTGNEQSRERNITELIDYIQYNNFEVTESKIYSIFDYLYKQYTEERRVYLQKHKKVSEYDSENLMYSLIEDIISANKYSSLDVVCHFPLNMLIKNPELLNEQECQYAMNPATHLDFLIYNRIGKKPVLAIEVDGYEYHKEDTVQASRDLLKNHIMELYEVPLLRFMTNGSGEKEKIIEMLDKLVG